MSRPPRIPRRDKLQTFKEAAEWGERLLKIKAELPRSESFVKWVDANWPYKRRRASDQMDCAKILWDDPEAEFPSVRKALASLKHKPQAVARPPKVQRLVQAIATRMVELENSPQAEALYHAASPEGPPPRKDLERHVVAWTVLLQKHWLTM
jgi:hypothetical protein